MQQEEENALIMGFKKKYCSVTPVQLVQQLCFAGNWTVVL